MTAERIDCLACRGLATSSNLQQPSPKERNQNFEFLSLASLPFASSIDDVQKVLVSSSQFQIPVCTIDSVFKLKPTESTNCYYLWFKLTSFFIFDLIGTLDESKLRECKIGVTLKWKKRSLDPWVNNCVAIIDNWLDILHSGRTESDAETSHFLDCKGRCVAGLAWWTTSIPFKFHWFSHEPLSGWQRLPSLADVVFPRNIELDVVNGRRSSSPHSRVQQ